jgi:D-hydroxyproline dehydrogenase subunit gamma
MNARFVRLGETDRPKLTFTIDGRSAEALEGDSLLTALLINGTSVRSSEFDAGRRAGFCLMAACQDCWVWTDSGERLCACDTPLAAGMAISTRGPGATWANRA